MLLLPPSRRWLLTLALLVLAAPARALTPDPYLPNDSGWAVNINVRQILDSSVVKKIALEKLKTDLQREEIQDILKSLDFDPLKDSSSIVVGGPGGNDEEVKFLGIVHGKFDPAKFQATAEDQSKTNSNYLKIDKEGAYTLYEISISDLEGGTKPLFVTIMDENTAVISGIKDYVIEALDKKAGKKKSELKPELKDLLERAKGDQSVSFVGLGDAVGKNPLATEKTEDPSEKIKTFTGNFHIAEDVNLNAVVAAKDAESAKKVLKNLKESLDVAKGFLGFMAINYKMLLPVVDALDVLEFSAQDNNVTIKAQVTAEMIEKSLKKDEN